jgi:hypothetical protein
MHILIGKTEIGFPEGTLGEIIITTPTNEKPNNLEFWKQ